LTFLDLPDSWGFSGHYPKLLLTRITLTPFLSWRKRKLVTHSFLSEDLLLTKSREVSLSLPTSPMENEGAGGI